MRVCEWKRGSFHPAVRFASSSLLLVPRLPLFCFVCFFFLSFAVLPPAHIYRDALQLSGEGGVQGLRRDLQPVGDVGRGPEHLLEGPGFFPESGKEGKKREIIMHEAIVNVWDFSCKVGDSK